MSFVVKLKIYSTNVKPTKKTIDVDCDIYMPTANDLLNCALKQIGITTNNINILNVRYYDSIKKEFMDHDISRHHISNIQIKSKKYEFVLEDKSIAEETQNNDILQNLQKQVEVLTKRVDTAIQLMETTIRLNNQNPVKENGEHLKEVKNIDRDNKIESHIKNENIHNVQTNNLNKEPSKISIPIVFEQQSEAYNPRLSHASRYSPLSLPYTETLITKPITPPPIQRKPKEQDGTILPKDVWRNTITRRVLEPENDVPIGSIFDVCEEKFNQINILKNRITKGDQSIKTLSYIAEEPNLKKFFEAFSIEDELKASIICGLTKIPDYAKYFTFYQLNGEVMMTLVYSIIVKSIQIDQDSKLVLHTLNLQKASNVTHFLTGIDYGFTAVLCIKHPILQTIQETKAKLKDVLENFKLAIDNKTALKREYSNILVESLNFDYLPNKSGLQPGNISEALKTLQSLASTENIDYSGPIRYHLAPLFPLINSKNKAISKSCPKQILDTLIQSYIGSRESTLSTRKFNGIQINLSDCYPFIPKYFEDKINLLQKHWKEEETKIQIDIKMDLWKFRQGSINEDAFIDQVLSQYEQLAEELDVAKILKSDEKLVEKLIYITSVKSKGVLCLGKEANLKELIYLKQNCYVFFCAEIDTDVKSINSKIQRFFTRLIVEEKEATMIFVDLETVPKPILIENFDGGHKISKIVYYENRKLSVDNVFEKQLRKMESQRCFIQKSMKTVRQDRLPAFKTTLKIICPNSLHGLCSSKEHEWFCEDCKERIFYGLDHCVHCKCGTTSVSNCLYKCNDIEHGKEYKRFEDMSAYKKLLNNLPKPKEQNILLLGETGVGKSTFINAFANYLKFYDLQEALESEPVCMIASKYSVEADLNVRSYKDKWITVDIGDATELPKIPTGQSVTQNAMAYTFEVNGTVIRIIDTPGVNDTRGQKQDDINFEAILRCISKYTHLNAILILLKPNEARLTGSFKKCLSDLFNYLHISAANNIIFGITNARNIQYRGGETLVTLEHFLDGMNHEKSIHLNLTDENKYFFENDAFRFLWAKFRRLNLRNEIDMKKGCQTAWNHSRREIERLINFVSTLKPHSIQEMVSTNNSRRIATLIAQPLADVVINLKQNLNLLGKVRTKIDQDNSDATFLLGKIYQVKMIFSGLYYPRLVCASSKCIEKTVKNDEYNIIDVRYKTCHENCILDELPASDDRRNIQKCKVFKADKNVCGNCGCASSDHILICYELSYDLWNKTLVETNNSRFMNNDDVQDALKKLDLLIQKFHRTYDQILESAAMFQYFLEKHTLEKSFDLFEEYLQMLSHNDYEKSELIRLVLKNYQEKKTQKINSIERQKTIVDPLYLKELVKDLFSLEICGSDIQTSFNDTDNAHNVPLNEKHFDKQLRF